MTLLTWDKDGAEIKRNFINKKVIKKCLDSITKLEKKGNNIPKSAINEIYNNKNYIRYIPKCHEAIADFSQLINSKIFNICANYLGLNVYFWDSDLHSRWGSNSVNTPPHQDSFLKCLNEKYPDMITCYIPLTKIDKKSNPMHIIKGSFKKKTLPHKRSKILGFSSIIVENENLLQKSLKKNEAEILLNPGDVFFFHGKTIHYSKHSKKNINSNNRRIAVAIRILGENVRFSKKKMSQYIQNVKYNRSFAIKQGLTKESKSFIKRI